MAATYIPIASTTLTTSAASVTFSAIPQTYTDLVLKFSARSNANYEDAYIKVNGSWSGVSSTMLYGTGSGVGNGRQTNSVIYGKMNSSSTASNTFTNVEIYFPNYNDATTKPASISIALEDNVSSPAYIGVSALLQITTTAITSLEVFANSSQFVSGSTFHLYGIKNS